jgi:hypothetical protein
MSDELDSAVVAATELTARTLEADLAAYGFTKVGEVKHMQPAFRRALSAVGVDDVQKSEKKLSFATWEPRGVGGRLGGVDVIAGAAPNYRAFFELKWAATKHELGWTLLDIYKLAAGRLEYGVKAYAIVGAPMSYWIDENVDCSALYCDSSWESRQIFRRYGRAWADLLKGGSARPHRVPASITTRLIAACPLDTSPKWGLRALAVDADDAEWLEFDGDWPVGHQDGAPEDVAPDA